MILTCPACSTRYMVDPPDLGRSGRRVRCAKCGHSWIQGPAPDLPKAVTMGAEAESETLPRRAGPRFAAQAGRRKSAVGWLILLLVIGGGGFSVYHFRQQIVEAWPPATRLYTELGIPLKAPGQGLEIRNLNLSRARRDKGTSLVVAGEIANLTKQPIDVPMLRAALLDSQRHELQHWLFAAGHDRLLPGEVAAFETEVANPKQDATNISITFTYARPPAAAETPATSPATGSESSGASPAPASGSGDAAPGTSQPAQPAPDASSSGAH